jgi:putative ABC transport system permease protein
MFSRAKHKSRALRDGAGMDRELDTEVRFHIEMETEKYIRQGMTPEQARTLAMRNFGPMKKRARRAA